MTRVPFPTVSKPSPTAARKQQAQAQRKGSAVQAKHRDGGGRDPNDDRTMDLESWLTDRGYRAGSVGRSAAAAGNGDGSGDDDVTAPALG